MATKKEEVQSDRARELELIINELDELNEEARDKNVWIRTKWNLPNQKAWHLGTSDTPERGAYNLGMEHVPPVPYVWKWANTEQYLMKLIDLCPLELTERQSVLLTNPAYGNLDLGLDWDDAFGANGLGLNFYWNNVLDNKTTSGTNGGIFNYGLDQDLVAEPPMFGLKATYRF